MARIPPVAHVVIRRVASQKWHAIGVKGERGQHGDTAPGQQTHHGGNQGFLHSRLLPSQGCEWSAWPGAVHHPRCMCIVQDETTRRDRTQRNVCGSAAQVTRGRDGSDTSGIGWVPHPGGPQPSAERPPRRVVSPLACREHTVSGATSMELNGCGGLDHRVGRGQPLAVAASARLFRQRVSLVPQDHTHCAASCHVAWFHLAMNATPGHHGKAACGSSPGVAWAVCHLHHIWRCLCRKLSSRRCNLPSLARGAIITNQDHPRGGSTTCALACASLCCWGHSGNQYGQRMTHGLWPVELRNGPEPDPGRGSSPPSVARMALPNHSPSNPDRPTFRTLSNPTVFMEHF